MDEQVGKFIYLYIKASHFANKLSSANLYYFKNIFIVFLMKSWEMTLEDPHNY